MYSQKHKSMNTQLAPDDKKVINQIIEVHKPETNFDVDGNALLSMVQDILSQAIPTLPPNQEGQKDNPHQAISDELAITIHEIGCKLSCNCFGWGDMKSITQAVFNTLVKYSWEDKVAIALSAFAVNFGEFCLLSQEYSVNHLLAKSVVHLKPLPDIHERETLINSLLQKVIDMTKTIIKLNGLTSPSLSRQQPPLSEAVNEFPNAAYLAIKGIVACSSQSIGLMEMGPHYRAPMTETRKNLINDPTQRLNEMHEYLEEILKRCNKVIEKDNDDKTYRDLQRYMASKHDNNMEFFFELIGTKHNQPLFNGETLERVTLEKLERKQVILFISYWHISESDKRLLQQKVKPEGQYETVWIPIEEESETLNEKKAKIIDQMARSMKWYSLHYSVKLSSHVIKYIKEDWHFEEEPLLVVIDAQGDVVSSNNAYHMAMIWGSAAFPFNIKTEKTLWQAQESNWNLKFLIDGVVDVNEIEKLVKGEKLTCLYGGDDLDWIKKFISKMKDVVKGDGITLEFRYVGTKYTKTITEDLGSSCWSDPQNIGQFRARLYSIMRSIMQPHITIKDKDIILRDVKMLLGAHDSGQGWTIIGHGPGNMFPVNGIIMEYLDYIERKGVTFTTIGDFFTTLDEAIKEVARKDDVYKHCHHIIISSNSGINRKDMVCADCRRLLRKYTMYKCCVE